MASQKAPTMLENAFKVQALLYKQLHLYNHGRTSRSYSRALKCEIFSINLFGWQPKIGLSKAPFLPSTRQGQTI